MNLSKYLAIIISISAILATVAMAGIDLSDYFNVKNVKNYGKKGLEYATPYIATEAGPLTPYIVDGAGRVIDFIPE